jgi:signal transduction histidine kinase
MLTDPDFKPWRKEAIKRGYASSIALPLKENNKVFGALMIYSKEPNTFTENEVQLLNELADDIASGITTISLKEELKNSEEKYIMLLKQNKETLEKIVEERTEALLHSHNELEKVRRLSDIGTLAATIAHELRNPLAAIKLANFNIRRKEPLLKKHTENIDKKITESNQIIDNLLFYSRTKEPHFEKILLYTLLKESEELVKSKTNSANITIINSFENLSQLMITIDQNQIREVLNNIINNAADAISGIENGKIQITGNISENTVEIQVKDNGIGISPIHLQKVFEPFFSTKAKGTGLGLVVAKQIIDNHKGTIKIDSTEEKGTTVIITLPKYL